MDRLLVLLAVLAATAAFAAWWRARDGRVIGGLPAREAEGAGAVGTAGHALDDRWSGLPREAADVAAAVGPSTPLVLVEFTAPGCAPCARARVVLDEVSADRADVSVAALDVGDALDLARAHRILRAPTTLLVSAEGHLLGRVSGVPRADELRALLDGTADRVRA